jgi:predicted esterase
MRHAFLGLFAVLGVGGLPAASMDQARDEGKADASKGELKDERGQFVIRYAVSVPRPLLPRKTLGMIVGMHGLGGDEHQQIGSIQEGLSLAQLSREYMILGLKARESGWNDADNERIAFAIQWALRQYPVDPRRVYTWGYSSGGFGTGRFVPRYPKLAAGGVMWAGGLWDPPKVGDGGEPDPRLYLIHGDKDPTVKVETGRKSVEALQAAKYRYVYRELAGADHGLGGPGNAPCKKDAVLWIHSLRNRTVPLSDDDRKAVEDLTAKLKEGKSPPAPAALARLLDLSGPEVEAALAAAFGSDRAELRKAAAVLCQQRVFAKTVMAGLVPLLEDKDAPVRAAAVRALGVAAHWNAPEALDALAALAKDVEKPATDRFNAAAQLGLAAPIQLFCTNREPRVFETLTALAEDKNGQLKGVARMGLDGKLVAEGQGVKVKP